jgi:DNA-binding NtrC family response regulator
VVVDCGGLPEPLVEAELFGHERGAFTGAERARAGAFEEADTGTLFLDEVAELSPALQAKLLRALEARTVKRLGANQWRKVDVRVIAATHQDLARLCNQRQFREDLYFRLAVLTVRLPPLRERLEDLPLLVNAILEESRESGGSATFSLDDRLLEALRARHWAGNVRELKNVVQRALVLGADSLVSSEDERAPRQSLEDPFKIAKARAVEQFEKQYLTDLLARHRGNVAGAARAAEVDAAWIFRLVKRHAIDLAKLRRQ